MNRYLSSKLDFELTLRNLPVERNRMQSESTSALIQDMAINSNNNGMRSSLFVTAGRAVPQLRKLGFII